MKIAVMLAVVAGTSLSAAAGGLGKMHDDCLCYRDVRYGGAEWFDESIGKTLTQDYDFWPAFPGAVNQPLIVYAHPGRVSKTIKVNTDPEQSKIYDKVIVPARAAGYAVASIEYRHPVENEDIDPLPDNDIPQAIQALRAKAGELGIDPNNVFLMGSSRGTLVVWAGVQPEGMQPGKKNKSQSTRVNAVYAYNAQASYRGQEVADLFIYPAQRELFVADYRSKHPKEAQFGSALADITADDPPMRLNYEGAFYRTWVPARQITVHHPDFGLALCAAYATAGIGTRCEARDQVPSELAYDGFIAFFDANRQ